MRLLKKAGKLPYREACPKKNESTHTGSSQQKVEGVIIARLLSRAASPSEGNHRCIV
ncbi:hypothetical protein ES703_56988 [subsurface metagenome]